MTDNSDFMTRYLRSDDNDRREHPTPPPVDDEGVTVVEPEISQPAAPQRMPTPAGGYRASRGRHRSPAADRRRACSRAAVSAAEAAEHPGVPADAAYTVRAAFRSGHPAAIARRVGTSGESGRKMGTSRGSTDGRFGGWPAHSGRRGG